MVVMFLRYNPSHKIDKNTTGYLLHFYCDCGAEYECQAITRKDFEAYCNSLYSAAVHHISNKHPNYLGPGVIYKLWDNMGLSRYLNDHKAFNLEFQQQQQHQQKQEEQEIRSS